MALIDRNREATARDLRVFGVLLTAFCGVVGVLGLYHTDSWTLTAMIWGGGLLVSVLYYAVPATRTLIFQGWMTAVFPIGWFISHALLVVVYYGVITPIGLALRLWSRDLLHQERDPLTSTYWVACTPRKDIKQYFQQF